MKIILNAVSLFLLTSWSVSAQQTDFDSYLSGFSKATLPFICCTPFSNEIETNLAQKFIYSQPIATKNGLYDDSGYQYGHLLLQTSNHVVLVLNQINSLWRANRQVIVVHELSSGKITDIKLAKGRKNLGALQGVEQYVDYTFSVESDGKFVLQDFTYMITEDGPQKVDENKELFRLNDLGIFLKVKK